VIRSMQARLGAGMTPAAWWPSVQEVVDVWK
jgi:hypothetical protein